MIWLLYKKFHFAFSAVFANDHATLLCFVCCDKTSDYIWKRVLQYLQKSHSNKITFLLASFWLVFDEKLIIIFLTRISFWFFQVIKCNIVFVVQEKMPTFWRLATIPITQWFCVFSPAEALCVLISVRFGHRVAAQWGVSLKYCSIRNRPRRRWATVAPLTISSSQFTSWWQFSTVRRDTSSINN